MSNQKPIEPEGERKQIVSAALDSFMKSHPEWAAKPKDDLTVLFEGFEAKCREVNTLLTPVIETVITDSSIHTAVGRRQFMLQAHKQFIEAFHGYNREELLFLLAWTHANLLTQANA